MRVVFSTAVIVFELTGGYAMTIALLLAVSISNGLNHAVYDLSFFHWQLGTRGLFLQEGAHKHIVRSLRVRAFMERQAPGDMPVTIDPEGKTPKEE